MLWWETWPLPSVRLSLWVGVGALLWIAATMLPPFRLVAVAYDIGLLLLAIIDLLISPRPRDFEIEREVSDKMNLGVPNTVTLRAHSRARSTVRLTVRDEPPATWPVTEQDKSLAAATVGEKATARTAEATEFSLSVLGAGYVPPPVPRVILQLPAQSGILATQASGSYQVTPTRRGDFVFAALSARYSTILGLWYRQFRRPADLAVRVYPDTSEVRRYELRLREGKLRDMGLHLLRLRGRGTEFESLRDYTRDDEFKNINWKASARRGKLIATDYEIERDQTVIIALDCGRMMTAMAIVREGERRDGKHGEQARDKRHAGDGAEMSATAVATAVETVPVSLSKLDCAINAAVLLSHVSASMGDAVGLMLFSDTVLKWLPPKKGRQQTGAIIEALYAAQPSLVEPDYATAYEFFLARKMRRALVVTFTDLIDPDASRELLSASGTLRRHHNPLCVTINNRDVMEMAALLPEDAGAMYQKAMAQKMLRQRTSALEALRRNGVGILDVEASQLTIATVNRYLDLKSRGAL